MACVIDVTPGIRQRIEDLLVASGSGVTFEEIRYDAQCELSSGRESKLMSVGNGFYQYSFSMISIWVTLRLRVIVANDKDWIANIVDGNCGPAGPLAF